MENAVNFLGEMRMKNVILRTAIVVAFAVALMAGSALAEPVYIEGTVWFNGASQLYFTNASDRASMYSAQFLATNNAAYDYYVTVGSYVSGDFANYFPNPAWDPALAVPPGFPNQNGIYFKNDSGVLLDAPMMDTFVGLDPICWGGGECAPVLLGSAEDFDFWIGDTTSFTTDSADGYLITMWGYITSTLEDSFGDQLFLDTLAKYTFSYTVTSGDIFNTSITVETFPSGYPPPEVPEPGTLVLLGTGLLGAAIVARRKMKK